MKNFKLGIPLTLCGCFSAFVKKPVASVLVESEVELSIQQRKDKKITIGYSELEKGCRAYWDQCIRFLEPPDKENEYLFGGILGPIEVLLAMRERANLKVTGVNIEVKNYAKQLRQSAFLERYIVPVMCGGTALGLGNIDQQEALEVDEILRIAVIAQKLGGEEGFTHLVASEVVGNIIFSDAKKQISYNNLFEALDYEYQNLSLPRDFELIIAETNETSLQKDFLENYSAAPKKSYEENLIQAVLMEQEALKLLASGDMSGFFEMVEKIERIKEVFAKQMNVKENLHAKKDLAHVVKKNRGIAITLDFNFNSTYLCMVEKDLVKTALALTARGFRVWRARLINTKE